MASINEFYGICVKELHSKHNNHQPLKLEMDKMRVKEVDLVKRIGYLEITNNIIEENLHHVHKKINMMSENMGTFTLNDWKTEGKCEANDRNNESC